MRWLIVLMMMTFFIPVCQIRMMQTVMFVKRSIIRIKPIAIVGGGCLTISRKRNTTKEMRHIIQRKGKTDTAKSYQRKAQNEQWITTRPNSDTRQVQMKAADYLKRASNALEGQ